MNGGPSQSARVLAAAERDLRLHKLARRSNPEPEFDDADAYGFIARELAKDKELKRRADAEWNAMDATGQLPAGWEYRP